MAFKGKAKEQKKDNVRELYVGFASVKVVAINPTRAQLNKMLGKDETDGEEKEEFSYLDEDKDGNQRLRLAFWLYDEENDKYFVQSIKLVDADRISKDGKKIQVVNSVCDTTWVPFLTDKDGDITDKPDLSFSQIWFRNFTEKDTKELIGEKKVRKAIRGEEELVTLIRAWIGMDWYDPDTEVVIDTKKLFKENYKELRDMIGSEEYSRPFIILTGVRTNEEDPTKKYQEIYNKGYLPSGFMRYIKAGNKMPSDYTKKVWKGFTDDVKDEYGFNCFHKLVPLTIYDEREDPVATNAGKPQTAPADNEY